MRDLSFLKKIMDERIADIQKKENRIDKFSAERYTHYFASMVYDEAFLGLTSYCVKHSVEGFRLHTRQSANCKLKLMYGYDNGKPVSSSWASMLTYKDLLNALASGDIVFAEEFAAKMGGRGKIDTEVHPFDYKLGYCLKYLVLNEKEQALEWYEKFAEQCMKKGFKSYSGFVKILKGILDEDSALAQEGFDEFKKGYKVLIRGGSSSTHSEWLNHWGIGIANLAISRCLKLDINDEYIPKDLLIDVE